MVRYQVSGMTCGHCAQAVTRAVEALPMVERALVDLDSGALTVEGRPGDDAVRRAVEDAGYEFKGPMPAAG